MDECLRADRLRATRFQSPWSTLVWEWPSEDLDRLLVGLDGGRST